MDAGKAMGNTGGDPIGMSGRNSRLATANSQGIGQSADSFAIRESATMEELARSTGGAYFHDSGAMVKQLRSALADGRQYYVLSYVPKNTAHDGKFRTITVEANDKKLSLRAKQGYWAAGVAQ